LIPFHRLVASLLLILFPWSLLCAQPPALSDDYLSTLARSLEGLSREERLARSRPVALALMRGDSQSYERALDDLARMLEEPSHLRTLGPLASELARAWYEVEAEKNAEKDARVFTEIVEPLVDSTAIAAAFGLAFGVITVGLGILSIPVALAVAGATVVLAGVANLALNMGGTTWSSPALPPQMRSPQRSLPLERVAVDAASEARWTQSRSRESAGSPSRASDIPTFEGLAEWAVDPRSAGARSPAP
jgi:hypothetical protein